MKITEKVFYAIAIPAIFAVLTLSALLYWSVKTGFDDYLNAHDEQQITSSIETLQQLYERYGSWANLALKSLDPPEGRANHEPQSDFFRPPPESADHEGYFPQPRRRPPPRRDDGPDRPRPAPNDSLLDSHGLRAGDLPRALNALGVFGDLQMRITLLDESSRILFGPPPKPDDQHFTLKVKDTPFGFLLVHPRPTEESELQLAFLSTQLTSLSVFAVLIMVMCALTALWFARHLLGPLRAVVKGYHVLNSGDYSIRLNKEEKRDDELAQLILDFNALADTLEKNRTLRERWVADISHELRTPLTILRAEIESVLDGIYPLDEHRIRLLQQEVISLSQLVADLNELSMADQGALHYHRQPIQLTQWLQQSAEAFRPRLAQKQIQLEIHLPTGDSTFMGDSQRLHQLMTNLLENSFRYTDAGGRVVVTLSETANHWQIQLDDSAPGVPDWAMARLFERLFRVDKSRTRRAGGSGLGLAICQAITEAHGGTLQPSHSALGGLKMTLTLPKT